MVAHLDAVTSLAIDPNGIYLMSGSKCVCFFLLQLTVSTLPFHLLTFPFTFTIYVSYTVSLDYIIIFVGNILSLLKI